MVFGYPGLRVERLGVLSFTSLQPELPRGVTAVTLRGVHLFGVPFDFSYNATTICVRGQPSSLQRKLVIKEVTTGRITPIPPVSNASFCTSVQPVEVIAE